MVVHLPEERLETHPTYGRGTYRIYGASHAPTRGTYNSHIVFSLVGLLLVWHNIVSFPVHAFSATAVLCGLLLFDTQPLSRTVALTAIPFQLFLYLQLLVLGYADMLVQHLEVFVLFLLARPLLRVIDISFLRPFPVLMVFFVLWRTAILARYLYIILFHWDNPGPSFPEKKSNLATKSGAVRHMLWSYCIGTPGFIFFSSPWDLLRAGHDAAYSFVTAQVPALQLEQHLPFSVCLALGVVVLAYVWRAMPRHTEAMDWQYYKGHRTLHECPPLYGCIHAIHHRGVISIQLDSGTLSPAELFITPEMALPIMAVFPNWLGLAFIAWSGIKINIKDHDAAGPLDNHNHVRHHRYFTYNYGGNMTYDLAFKTQHDGDEATESSNSDKLKKWG